MPRDRFRELLHRAHEAKASCDTVDCSGTERTSVEAKLSSQFSQHSLTRAAMSGNVRVLELCRHNLRAERERALAKLQR
jgi:hypothetical protein